MKHRLLDLFYRLCAWFGVTGLFFFLNRRRTLHVTYHNVLPDAIFDNTPHLGMSHAASTFAAQVRVIAQCLPITVESEHAGHCRITFDDGYQNQGEVAGGILEEMGLRGVFFVPLEPLQGAGETLAVDQLLQWVSYAPAGAYTPLGVDLTLGDKAQRQAAFSRLYDAACADPSLWRKLPPALDALAPFAHLDMPDDMARLRFTPMPRDTLKSLAARGHRIACHGWDHRPLATLDDNAIAQEFARCAQLYQQHCNCDEFSYPFGGLREVDSRVVEACRRSPFSMGFLNTPQRPAWAQGEQSDFAIPRLCLPITETRPYVLKAKLSGLETFLKQAVRAR
ncbi:polysaccharide deacetylase family protein [Magnetofaba australis]|uniref:NodB homology domain-containing protein n=1 Tax=Magnetofaba australis IT-1 TaxID=1434232 RepID=A0A1Y2K7P6_9PROT|nr:polysaccharide deacetylase family protein [Magnetofaba australis]OSM04795.1 hypothetical protein MAIT1_02888 [Magnetofaba australis IT-1]